MGLAEDCKLAFEEAQAATIFSSHRGGVVNEARKEYEKVVKKKDMKKYKEARKALEDAIKAAKEAFDTLVDKASQSATSKVLEANDKYGKPAVKADPNCSKVLDELTEAQNLKKRLKKEVIDPAQKVLDNQKLP